MLSDAVERGDMAANPALKLQRLVRSRGRVAGCIRAVVVGR